MTLVIGGAGQGKLAWALQYTGLAADAVSPDIGDRPAILSHLETWLKEEEYPLPALEAYLRAAPEAVILCDEVGCGVVPVDPAERAWREETGRLCCDLAQRAQRVERIFCGLSMVLKGEGTWK